MASIDDIPILPAEPAAGLPPEPAPDPGPRPLPVWTHLQLMALASGIGLLVTVLIGIGLYLFVALDLPSLASVADYQPDTTAVILGRDGGILGRIHRENRTLVTLDSLPPLLPQAFVAAEDSRFFSHPGVDLWSVLRAAIHNLRAGAPVQGGSTITQQVARSLLLSREKTYARKLREVLLAWRIDAALSKDEILYLYLNQIYFGEGAYGVEAAAQTYFGTAASRLSLPQLAILAGLPQAPSRYSPFRRLDLAKKRQAYVLNRMAEEGMIAPQEARDAYAEPLTWATPPAGHHEAGYFLQQVRQEVEERLGREAWWRLGLTVETTLDGRLQQAATEAVQAGVAAWQKRQRRAAGSPAAQAALVALDPASGEILALVGGSDYAASQFNRAVQARRQPGSAFKPFIYAAALEQGVTPSQIFADAPLSLPGSRPGETWSPQNYDHRFHGPVTLRTALTQSLNLATLRVLETVGVERPVRLAHSLGIASPLAADLSLALGVSEVSLLELSAAYAAFANGGLAVAPRSCTRILDRHGIVLAENTPRRRRILSAETAFQMAHLLKGVVTEGTGRAAAKLARPAAGKTGTTDDNRDAWFIGFTPNLLAGVWMGHDRRSSLGREETGGRAAVPIWLDFMARVLPREDAGADFVPPPGIELVRVDPATGTVLAAGEEGGVLEAFNRRWPLPAPEPGTDEQGSAVRPDRSSGAGP
ncbi:MAG: PBP1A family penicillin-binding protein [Thermodesulfobacteriota bacterium]